MGLGCDTGLLYEFLTRGRCSMEKTWRTGCRSNSPGGKGVRVSRGRDKGLLGSVRWYQGEGKWR